MDTTTDPQAALGAALHISFDGRHYHYRSYRYEHFADAERYARQHADDADPDFVPDWQAPWAPNADEQRLMTQYDIRHADGRFYAAGFRYDSLTDAVAYVRLIGQRGEAA